MYRRPSPMATPRLSQPQQIVEISWLMFDLCSQRIFPLSTETAKTSSLPVVM